MATSGLERWIRAEEGYQAKPYRDSEGNLTIGIGYNLDAGMPEDEALVLARYRLWKLERNLATIFPWFTGLDTVRQSALIGMTYQLGMTGLRGFKRLLAACESGDWDTASAEALDSKWARQTPGRAQRTAAMLKTGRWWG
jgi:lysozyme